jgi:anti-sigma regulatory factor (Ser/Thr protein kinase)
MSTTRRVGPGTVRRPPECRQDLLLFSADGGNRSAPAAAGRGRALPRAGRGLLSWTLGAGDAARVSKVRHQVMTALRGRAAAEGDLDCAELVVAELLNNALAHTAGPAWVALSWDGPHPLLSVTDLGPGFAGCPELLDEQQRLVPRLPEDALSEHGRGLYLVARLTHDLVVTPRPTGGSVVSVTLKLHRRGAAGTAADT